MKRLVGMAGLLFLLICPDFSWARGGGGCLEEGTLVRTLKGSMAIEKLKVGDLVWGVAGGRLREAKVRAVMQVQPEEYLEISAGGALLRVTPEHPVMAAPGEFHLTGRLLPGDRVFLFQNRDIKDAPVHSIRRLPARRPAYNLLVSPGGTFIAGQIILHNKGCFLPDSPILMADGTETKISAVKPGDSLWAFKPDGHLVPTKARSIIKHEVDEYVLMQTDRAALQVTVDHPFYMGQGKFKTVEALKVGNAVMAFDGKWLAEQRIISMERIRKRVRVFNLQTDQPNTFFANGLAVHNKGGGCFPAGTGIATPQGRKAIEQLAAGDEVLSVDREGRTVSTLVKTIFINKSPILKLETHDGWLLATRDHPVSLMGGGFRPAGDLKAGDPITRWKKGRLIGGKIHGVAPEAGQDLVFNLEVDEPHTFIAEGIVVHNKGGGGGSFRSSRSSSGSHSGSGRSSGKATWEETVLSVIFTILIIVFLLIVIIAIASKSSKGKKDENLDFVYNRAQIAPKADKTGKLLAFIGQQDPSVTPEALKKLAQETFIKLQECWGKREYDPMKPLLMPDLFVQHTTQLQGLQRNHEINRIDDLMVEQIDLVHVRYTEKVTQREFTALITASARDYYLDDRTGKFLRGDHAPARFQEFWTFQLLNGRWLLREIEQAGESDLLKEENFAEMITEDTLMGIYGEKAAPKGEAGPWLEKEVEQKSNRIDRLLNFLSQTDKLWNRNQMLEQARRVFLDVYLARESGAPGRFPTADLFPNISEDLRTQLGRWKEENLTGEYRNLSIRKAELLLVRNFADNSRDEFMVRISAHAQKIIRKGEKVVSAQEYVTPFEEYWTFGRLDGQWKLKEILPPGRGEKMVTMENVDQDSTPDQLEWYYRQPRAN
ncbi:MAG: TIM44-like domain-containing protein [Deltaproteobacteria bacterium]|nr:TIM44-like domain-containing protein [Deltaproteobacteria bacterium]